MDVALPLFDETPLPPAEPTEVAQRSLDDLGVPLSEVTFCVVDVETTGSAVDDRITEIGAVKLRGGTRLGTFQTMVNPGLAIPTPITVVTGITQAMVARAPRIGEVLPSFLEFVGDAVLVGHNVRFDTGFLNRALAETGRPRLRPTVVDTLALARRLLVDEVPNCRLGTLADRLRLPHRPTHRALDDALATGDLLHVLLERCGSIGVLGLDDLLQLPRLDAHPQAAKLRLTTGLPRTPGVYQFVDRDGRVLYIGKATDLRARVRSYFSSDRRKKVAQLLRETDRIRHLECPGPLEADVVEVRLIARHAPRFNRRAKHPDRYVYLKLTLGERFPRLSVARKVLDDGGLYLGPLPSAGLARRAIDAIEQACPVRRCTKRSTSMPSGSPCAAAQLGVATCPCSGFTPAAAYDAVVAQLVRGLRHDHRLLLDPLAERMQRLAADDRFEEAADVRDRGAALATVLRRQQRLDGLRAAGRLVVETPTGGVELDSGILMRSWTADGPGRLTLDVPAPEVHPDRPVPKDAVDELVVVAGWLEQRSRQIVVRSCEGTLSLPRTRLPSFTAARPRRSARDAA